MAGPNCEFVDDINPNSAVPQYRLIVNGTPGGAGGLNANYNSTLLTQKLPLCAGCCDPNSSTIPTAISIQSDQGLVLGQVNKNGTMTVTLGNDAFTGDYTEFILTTVDSANRYAAGTFRMFATNHANPQDQRALMILQGSFGGTYP
jgi:hypothetical protein